jgi:transaldolase
MTDPLALLTEQGVSIWLDDLSRDRLTSGGLATLVAQRHVVGVTSNPTIFQKAVAEAAAYDGQLADLARRGVSVEEAARAITTYDVRWAADVLRDVYESTGGRDGYVSLEVDPRLAHDPHATLAEARALWWMVDRPNLLIKIPATQAGLPAVTGALAEGINVNVTLIFGLERYRAVIDAWLSGLEQAHAAGRDLTSLSSVASFFVSRVDTEVDRRLDKLGTPQAAALRGTAAIANARLAYHVHREALASARWAALAALGARPQRPLWASTSVKDPSYDDTRYVTELVAPGTVNTMPEPTLRAVADHGVIRGDTVTDAAEGAQAVLDGLADLGVSYDEVVEVLEREGVDTFESSWRALLDRVSEQLSARAHA